MARIKQMPPPDQLLKEKLEVQVTFRLTPSQLEALQEIAGNLEIGHASLCRRIIQEYLAQHGRKPKRRK